MAGGISYDGFGFNAGDVGLGSASLLSRKQDSFVGLGKGLGASLVRSCLVSTGSALIDPIARKHALKNSAGSEMGLSPRRRRHSTLGTFVISTPRNQDSLLDEKEPQGLWFALLTGDMSPVSEQDIAVVKEHRWTFVGASELGKQGRSVYYFILCLLEIQRNIQVEEEGEVLDARLVEASKTFVKGQCRQGHYGEMYQVLSHFLSNSLVFVEWERYLTTVLGDSRANQESFLVDHVEQVLNRFKRLKAVLESIFDLLDSRFTWKHRLPKVADLVHEHMKRRCFSSELVERNELIAGNAARDDRLKQVKFAFGFG